MSDCGDTPLRTGDTCTVKCAPGSVLGVGDTEQTFSCQSDGVVSGTQPVCEPLPCSAPKTDSEYRVDVCIAWLHVRAAIPLWEIRLGGPVRRTVLGLTAVSPRASCKCALT